MKRVWIPVFAVLVFLAQALHGVVPQKWEMRSKDDFLKGKFYGISVNYDGILSLSPKEEEIKAPAEEFYLSLLLASEQEIYLGTGHGGKIYRIGKNAEPELYFQVPEMGVYCLARDKKGNLYAGTSPNGKIYKITDKGKGAPFFNPREKYIWDLLFTQRDVLLAAVGENGGVYEINKQGEGKLILKSEENHILCIKENKNEDLIVGTGGKGLLYRVPRSKKVSVLFESPHEEIKSIALDEEGNIYAAASGAVFSPEKKVDIQVPARAETGVAVTVTPSPDVLKEALLLGRKQPGTLYKINPEGMARKLWSSSDELIYSLIWNEEEKRLVFGTGDKGRIYAVDKDEKVSLLVQKKSEQIYHLLPFQSEIYLLSNNPSILSVLYPEQVFQGEYLSQVMDAKTISSWGRIEWEAEIPSGTTLQFQTRSGNSSRPNETWSNWSPPYQKEDGEQILSPKARYLQFKVLFKTQSGKITPLFHKISLFYLQTNIAPVITRLTLLPASVVFLKLPEQAEVIWGDEENLNEKTKAREKLSALILTKKVEKKGFQTITWEASDENEDDLQFSLYIKEVKMSKWRVLKEKWRDTIYAFDTFSFPDGIYIVKVVATDIPSNPKGSELSSDKISRPLIIDNSLPVIRNFKVVRNKSRLTVTFFTEDSMSFIKEVKYLIRPDEWCSVFPVDGICDSKNESFEINITLPPKFDNLITVKVKDSHGNIGVHRHTF